jgi:hypothetical protein
MASEKGQTAKNTRVLDFNKIGETKGTWRFEEQTANDAEPVVGSLYVKKHALTSLGSPDKLTVTVEGK